MSRPAQMLEILNRLKFTHLSNSGCFMRGNLDPLPQEENTDSAMFDNGTGQNIGLRGT